MAGGLVPIDQNRPADLTQSVHFGHNYPEESPETPGRVRPDVAFVRKVFNDKLEFSDGEDVEYWAFKDPDDDKPFPSTPIRVRQGQIVHTTIEAVDQRAHDPPPRHRAVHLQRRGAGLLVQRQQPLHLPVAGLPGGHVLLPLPPQRPAARADGHVRLPDHRSADRPRHAVRRRPAYDVEAMWATYDIDPTWRDYNHASGEKNAIADRTRLNRFRPRYFTINGVDAPAVTEQPQDDGAGEGRPAGAAAAPDRRLLRQRRPVPGRAQPGRAHVRRRAAAGADPAAGQHARPPPRPSATT